MNSGRRRFSKTGLVALPALLAGTSLLRPILSSASDDKWNKRAFDAKTIGDAERALGNLAPVDGLFGSIDAPQIAENGAVVPVVVEGKAVSPATIALAVTSNPTPLAAYFTLEKGVDVFIRTRIRMRETSSIVAIIGSEGKYDKREQPVKVVLGGCETAVASAAGNKRPPSEPMRIKAVKREEKLEVRILVPHDMDPGLTSAGSGVKRNVRFIDRVVVWVRRDGKSEKVLTAQLSPGVSKNPFLNFRVGSADKVTSVIVIASDNTNVTQHGEFLLPPKEA
jgi:sulfur-oxidizing protein SoxY